MFDPDVMARIAERKIQEALEQGKFDNLPCKGQPLHLEENSPVPPHLRAANRVLKNMGGLPEWALLLREIEAHQAQAERLRVQLTQQSQRRRSLLKGLPPSSEANAAYQQWCAQARATYLQHLLEGNLLILRFSLLAPASIGERAVPYCITEEMAAFDLAFLPGPVAALPSQAPPKQEGFLRRLMRSRYKRLRNGA